MAVSGDFTVSCGTCETYQVTTNSENVLDDVFWTRGKHHFGFGGNYIHNHMNLQGTNNANGQFTFNGSFTGDALADFMLGDLYSLYQGNDTGSTFAKNVFAFYAQDSYQVTPEAHRECRRSLGIGSARGRNRGPRRQLLDVGVHGRNHVHRLQDRASRDCSSPAIPESPRAISTITGTHFEPRFGIAWDPRGKGRESIRASYTLGFSQPIVYMEDRFENNAPYGDAITINPAAGSLSDPYAAYPGGNPFPQPYPAAQGHRLLPHRRLLFPVPCQHEAELHADLEPDRPKAARHQLGSHGCLPRQPRRAHSVGQ